MTRARRRWPARRTLGLLTVLALTALTAGGLLTTAATPAAAAPGCLIPDPGARTPILLVHGFNSTAHTWDSDLVTLNQPDSQGRPTSTALIAAEFAYGDNTSNPDADKALSDHWVTDPGIGHDLAQQIAYVAAASQAQGGTGKVVLIGHSMGGLAIRCALNAACNDAGQGSLGDLSSKVADIITFGTPLTGSFLRGGRVQSDAEHAFGDAIVPLCRLVEASHPLLASKIGSLCDLISSLTTSDAAGAFAYGSPQLAALPAVPNGTPLLALAGRTNVTASIGPLWHHTLAGDAGDLVVGTDSALAGGTRYGDLGGTHVEDCGTVDLSAADYTVGGAYLFIQNMLASLVCEHTSETSDGAFLAAALADINHLPHGRWTDPAVTITGSSLGAVTSHTPLTKASQAAGVAITAGGDGAYYSRVPGLELRGGLGGNCFTVFTGRPGTPQVRTPDGFVLGQSVTDLQHLYGARLHYSPGSRATGGYYGAGALLDAGWWVPDNGGYLLFQTTDGSPSGPITSITSASKPAASTVCSPG